ncbi:helix-turn-helix domain-containing protein [Amycolatopsis acidicola]|uniref:Helix-turn-helix domain-containing protein n=1 Tax=Amycolatopsis acidicola TaxID=2596893 RepID=A0A5N0V324_9PSEU|nr:helix-turn-helix domain-containing protein [Amycolatopsis acidicola]KAA9159319.1 helix-turn-helix domain-containing protein [Amycolatopsis acidicola]
MDDKTRSASPPTERVIAVVELLAARANGSTAAQIADELGLSRSTALAILTVLTERGWASRAPDLRYRPGPRLPGQQPVVPGGAERELAELAAAVGCGAALSLVSGTELTFVSVLAGEGRVPAGITPGTVLPLRAPAGAAVVAFRTEQEQQHWLATATPEQHRRLRRTLAVIRSTGVAAWGIGAAEPAALDVLADVVEHLAGNPAPNSLRQRVFGLLGGISGKPYTATDFTADAELPLSYLSAPVFDAAGVARWELQLGPLRAAVGRAEREHFLDHLRQTAKNLSTTEGN